MRSLQEVLKTALDEAKDLFWIGKQSGNVHPDISFEDFCATHLVQILTPLMTAIQAHVETCSPFRHELEVASKEELPTAHVIGTFTVDGNALPPFYTRETQDEIGGQYTSRTHVGE